MTYSDVSNMPQVKVPFRSTKAAVKKVREDYQIPAFHTRNELMNQLYQKCKLVARSNASVILTGESGSGKEVLAQMIHNESDRFDAPFIAINCGALPKDIIENELFGHEKGAFTGALNRKEGCFELADGGTLFLDEIGEMDLDTQVKLLRVVETGAFRRLGGETEIKVDVRIVSATNKVLADSMKSGMFREDLYYRLGVVEFQIPPLRQRKDDIKMLTHIYLTYYQEKYSKKSLRFTEEAMEKLVLYDWPGNVRELRNVMEYVSVTCLGEVIEINDLPDRISGCKQENNPAIDENGKFVSFPLGTSMKEVETAWINQTLAFAGNNKSEAARLLGISRKTMHNKLGE